jgi:hypothetical protein
MALTTAYLVTTKNLESFLNALRTAKAPEKLTGKFLKNLEFTSSNDTLFIGILKGLGFVDDSGTPTNRYFQFLDQTQSGAVLAEAIREAYDDLFAINTQAQDLSQDEIKNKLRTLTQGQKSEKVISLMAATFKALVGLADWKAPAANKEIAPPAASENQDTKADLIKTMQADSDLKSKISVGSELHYNIQIHLPESRDPAVFDAIFQSLRKHLT